ncbi:DUF3667 domain-containing protein [Adhaeribacter terreus]|uniref:DUF3667 domain-containing protein n=1 Tax=Adhaeribacter terreus TaxID=529703 RepID=A0ABW0E9S3_9BACT
MAEKKRRKFNDCPNCTYQFSGINNYCPNCGQENHNLDVPFSHVVMEVLEGTLHFDTKIFRTLKILLFKPGQLTELFIQNKRAAFVPPIRMYVFISFIFFLIIAAVSGQESEKDESDVKIGAIISENMKKDNFSIQNMATMSDAELTARIKKAGFEPTEFNKNLGRKIGKFSAASTEERNHKVFKNVSLLMFALMPLFGLILQSVYFRQKKHYIQHLIFSIHFHCFAFITFSVSLLLGYFTHLEGFGRAAFLICLVYLLLALQRLFKQSWSRTILKTIYISGVYLLTLVVFMLIAIGISLVLI